MREMITFCLSKFFIMLICIILSILSFYIFIRLTPFDPVCYVVENCLSLTEEQRKEIYDELWGTGFFEGLTRWVRNFLVGNMGTSISTGKAVADIIRESGIYSLFVLIVSFLISILVTIFFMLLRLKVYRFLFLFDMPIFVPAYITVIFVGEYMDNFALSFILCCVNLALSNGITSRITRKAISHIATEDEHIFYSSFFFKKRFIILNYILRSGLLSTLSEYLFAIRHLIGNLVISESIFSVPGIGKALVDSLFTADYPVIISIILILSLLTSLCIFMLNVSIYFLSGERVRFQL